MYAIKTFDEEHRVLATGNEPELHRLVLAKYQHGEWQFPVVIEEEAAKPWDDAAYLASMRPDPQTEEREQIRAIRRAYHDDCHTIRSLAIKTGFTNQQVSHLVHKYSLRLRNQYWRAEKYNGPDDVITGQTIYILGDKLGAPASSIKQASYSNGLVCGYYISRVPKV
ncbi:prophage Lp2 protein 23 [Lactiplantibacillus plantarum]|nr:prophage Lp2 protein 23 [Lactiplantibacillus plantarum]MCG0813987.1 prophage Lp2 protein 23 [Lactiplantibacillus plantarum]MCG0879357.1 prophage Lp2 protein 23 [Lactiplantibacillus plantarum]MCG0951878.1 prophage Lp2 protein 23 [Lactiplantibacillus plantarum]